MWVRGVIFGGKGWRHSMRKLWSAQATSIARSEKPSLVFLKTSLTIRQRLTPARVFSTTTRAPEMISFIQRSATLNSLPLGFFWLKRQHAFGSVALETSIFAQ